MVQGLDVADVVNVTIQVGAQAVTNRGFGMLLVIGSSNVIDVNERIRYYTNLTQVQADFGSSAPEAVAAALYFSQVPRPTQFAIGRWAQAATSAVLHGGVLSASQQLLSNFTSITTGAFTITVDGVARTISGINLSAATSLAQVASIITTAIGAYGSLTWNQSLGRFDYISPTTGAASTLSYASAPGSGTDISNLLQLRSGQTSGAPVAGIVAETPLAAVTALAANSTKWYACMFAANTMPTDSDNLYIAAYIEGASPARRFGITSSNSAELATPNTSSLGYSLHQAAYAHTDGVWSTSSPYAVAGFYGDALTVDFTGQDTTLTMMWKQIIGLTPENLSESQAAALATNGWNVYVNYDNGAAITQNGTTIGGRFFDEVHGLDWLQNWVQTGVFNLMRTTPTKVPQTDPGIARIVGNVELSLAQSRRNGLTAPGTWTGPTIGQIVTGQTLTKGYYVFALPVASQTQADRELRNAPLIQAVAKMAGAVHRANVLITINR